MLSLVSLFPGGSAPSVRLIREGRRRRDLRTCDAFRGNLLRSLCPQTARGGGARAHLSRSLCPPSPGVRKGLRNLAGEMNGAARRGEGPGCAAAGEVEGGEDRGCGLGFESQAHRHCSRAPSRGGRGAERSGARCVCARGRAGRGVADGQTDRQTRGAGRRRVLSSSPGTQSPTSALGAAAASPDLRAGTGYRRLLWVLGRGAACPCCLRGGRCRSLPQARPAPGSPPGRSRRRGGGCAGPLRGECGALPPAAVLAGGGNGRAGRAGAAPPGEEAAAGNNAGVSPARGRPRRRGLFPVTAAPPAPPAPGAS